MTKPVARTNEVRFCYLIFASIEGMCGSNGAPFSTFYLGDTADIIFGYGAGALNDMPGCPKYAHQMPLVASLMGGGENLRGRE